MPSVVRSRRPDAGPGAARRLQRARTAVREARTVPVAAARRSAAGLTRRAAIMALVVCAVVVSTALPLRELLSQRSQIAAVQQQEAGQRRRVAALQQEREHLADPAYLVQLARERLHYARPGETAYVLVGEAPGAQDGAGMPATGAGSPWYRQLLGSLQADAAPPSP